MPRRSPAHVGSGVALGALVALTAAAGTAGAAAACRLPGTTDCRFGAHVWRGAAVAAASCYVGIWLYVIISGIFAEWLRGDAVYLSDCMLCWWLCASVLVLISMLGLCFLGLGIVYGIAITIHNKTVQRMHAEYEKKKHALSGPRREYYEGEVFQQKCYRLFDDLDADSDGSLDMTELRPLIVREFGENAESLLATPLFAAAFDENRDSRVQRGEFVAMMQFFSMLRFRECALTEHAAFEVLQLDPDTATHADVRRSYKQLALKYHPDKRKGDPPEEVERDMVEINNAKELLDRTLGPETTPPNKSSGPVI